MQDAKRKDGAESEDKLADRKSEATNDATLSEIEESEKDAPSSDTNTDRGPSPDGRLDESEELKDAGPM